jgi:hypothetical protein
MIQKTIYKFTFEFKELDPNENYGQVYIRTNNIEEWYQISHWQKPCPRQDSYKASPETKEFFARSDNNLLTLGKAYKQHAWLRFQHKVHK